VTVGEGVAAGAARRSAPTPRCPACPVPRGSEGLPREDSPRPSGRRVSEWPGLCSADPDVLALSVGSNGDGAIGDANTPPRRAARRSRPFANPATPWRAAPKTADLSCGVADARECAVGQTTADAAPSSRARPHDVHCRAFCERSEQHDKRGQHALSCRAIDLRINRRAWRSGSGDPHVIVASHGAVRSGTATRPTGGRPARRSFRWDNGRPCRY
jgi:hypothetical protein